MKNMKKFVVMLLSIILVFVVVPVGVLATQENLGSPISTSDEWYTSKLENGEVVSGTEFEIATESELLALSDLVNEQGITFEGCTIKLTKADGVYDLNPGWTVGELLSTDGTEWTPIGTEEHAFLGTFDGCDKTIRGIYTQCNGVDSVGMFGTVKDSGTIKNFVLENSYIGSNGTQASDMGQYSGSIVGDFCGGAISGIYVKDSVVVKSNTLKCGGVVGRWTGNSTISEVWFDGVVEHWQYSNWCYVGGIAGCIEQVVGERSMDNCLMTGSITSEIADASIYGVRIGGFVGATYFNVESDEEKNDTNTIFQNCVSAGQTLSEDYARSSVIGNLSSEEPNFTFENVYATSLIPRSQAFGHNNIGFATSPIEMQLKELTGANAYRWTNLDFDNYWGAIADGTPVLRRFAHSSQFVDLTGVEKAFDTSWYNPENETYIIKSLKEMYGFALLSQSTDFTGKVVKLDTDIVVNSGNVTDWYNGQEIPTNPWITIGTGWFPFAGEFDGQGHTISGVYLKKNNNYIGVFGATDQTSIVKNLRVTNTFIDASDNQDLRYIGGVIGAAYGNVDTIYTDAIVKTDGYDCGGIIGLSAFRDYSLTSVLTINNCQFDGLLTGETLRRAGGIIGNAAYSFGGLDCRVLIKNCLNTGVIQSGIKSYDQVNSTMLVGGIVGYLSGEITITFEDCINVGTFDLVYKTHASAFVGRGSSSAMVTFKNCYTTKESASFAGTPIAYGGFSPVNTKGDVLIIDEERLSGLDAYKYTMLDFDTYWGAVQDGTPILKSFGENFLDTTSVAKMIDTSWYDETRDSFIINTREELYGFYQVVLTDTMEGKTFKLGKDIDMNPGWVASGDVAPEEPFFSINKFAGTFDGDNKVIKGIYIQDGAKDGIGLFSQLLEGGCIKNVILDNSLIQSTGSKETNYGWNTGGIVGNMLGGSINNIYVKDGVIVKSNMPYCGGIVGRMTGPASSAITEVWFDGHVISDDASSNMFQGFVGGVAGGAVKESDNRVIENCLMTGTVTGHSWDIGGILGGTAAGSTEFIKVTIKNCVATGKVTSVNQNTFVGSVIGGLEAKEAEFTLENIYTTENVENAGIYSTDNTYPGLGRIKKTVIKGATSKVSDAMLHGAKAYASTELDFWSDTNPNGVWVATNEGPELRRFSTSSTLVQSFEGIVRPDTNWYYNKQVDGEIPANTTFEIANEAEFMGFAKIVNLGVDSFEGHTVKLTKSIDLNPGWSSGNAIPENASLTPDWKVNTKLPKNGNAFTSIGSGVSKFAGTFDGGMNTIKGVYIYSENTDGVGLFARTEATTVIKNLKLDNSYIESRGDGNNYNAAGWYVGAIAGVLKGTIDSCYTSPSVIVTSNKSAIGGMVGMFESSEGQIKNSLSESSVVSYFNTYTDDKKDNYAGRLIGGLVGYVKSAPQDKAMIESSMFDGIIISPDYIAGGIIGQIGAAGVIVEDSYSAGTIYANHSSRLGVVAAYITGDTSTLTCENVYATTALTNLTNTRVIGDKLQSSDDKLAIHLLKGYNIVDFSQVVGKRAYTYTNLDFYWKGQNESASWYATAEGPQLRTFATSMSIVDDFTGVFKPNTKWYEKKLNADGTIPANTIFEIATAGELYSFAQLVDSGELFEGHTVKLTAKEYDFNPGWDASTMAEPTGEDAIIWNPIGDASKNFQGTFEGNDAVIKGVYTYQDKVKGTGFFSYIGTKGKVQNFTLSNSYIKSTGAYDSSLNDPILGSMTGAVAGRTNGIIDSVFVDNSVYVHVNTYRTGGLTGMFDGIGGGYIQNSWFAGTIYLDVIADASSRIVGGLVGEFWDNPAGRAGLKNCLYTGKIYAKNFMIGGLVGQLFCNAVIEDCLSNGEIYAEYGSRLSSIVGWAAGTRTLTFRNVYGITKLYNYNGTSARDERTDTLGGSTTMGAWKIKPEADLIGTKAYENTLLDLCVKGENEDGVWVALASKAPELKKFSKATDVVNEFDGLFRPPLPQEPIVPTDEWFTSKLVGGQVVAGTVFEIATVSDLLALPDIVNNRKFTFEGCTVKLTSAVYDLNPSWTLGQDLPEGANIWQPVGVNFQTSSFKGTFTGEYETGKSATIKGVYVNHMAQNTGFFGELMGSVSNLKFENSYIFSSELFTGTVCGRLSLGEVKNVYVADTVLLEGAKGYVGGILGRTSIDSTRRAGIVDNCWVAATIKGPDRIGGIIAQIWWAPSNKECIDNCLFTGTIESTGANNGGLIGHCDDTIYVRNSVVNGKIYANGGYNGLVCGLTPNKINAVNVYATGNVYNTDKTTVNTSATGDTSKYTLVSANNLKGDNALSALSLNFWSSTNTNGVWVVTDNGPELAMFTDRVLNLTLTKAPTKLTYVQGQPIDLEGAEVLLEYQGGRCETVSLVELEGVELIYDNMLTGDVFVSIIYQESVGSVFTITVNSRVLTHISVEPPTKVSYIEGQEFDLTGGAVRVWFESDDNYSELIPLTEDMISGFNNSVIGTQNITVTYQGHEDTFDVNVAAKKAIHMEVLELPQKQCYQQGATSIDVTGATVQVWYDNGTNEIITVTEDMVTNFDSSTVGFTSVKITYGDAVAYFDVLITDMYVYAQAQEATVGKTVQVPIYINNPSGFAYLKLKVGYDRSALELVGIENQSLFNGSFLPSESLETNPQVLLWAGASDTTDSGCIAVLTFRVLDDALSGTYNVDISFSEAYNSANEDIYFATESTTIVVNDYMIGDVNGDDVVNGKDATLILQYLAGWDVEVNAMTADTNADGEINGKDVTHLMQYLAGWDVILG